jgi:RNA polymerase nonessential primary-like sigma factor
MIATNLRFTIHSHEKQRELIAEAQKGDLKSRNELIESTMPWVMKLASGIYSIRRPPHLELDDLFQAGFFGLVRAIEKFDLERDNKFLTYASYWIRNQIGREIERCKAYRVPESVKYQVSKGIVKSNKTAASVLQFKEMMVVDHNCGCDGAPSEIFDAQSSPEENAEMNEKIGFLNMAIEDLDERSRYALRLRMEGNILKDIGTAIGLTRERVRQILVQIEKQLRTTLMDRYLAGDLF